MRESAVLLAVCLIHLQTLPFCGRARFLFGKRMGKLNTPKRVHYNYSGFDLGFFNKSGTFKSLPLPEEPKSLGFRLSLYPPGPGRQETKVDISTLTSSRTRKLNIKPGATLMFFVHGYDASSVDGEELIASTAMYRKLYLILVDWAPGASGKLPSRKYRQKLRRAAWFYKVFGRSYLKAASNARVVGSIIGHVISAIKRSELYSIKYIHCVGLSLGAHVCGFAGKTYSQVSKLHSGKMDLLDRITGLDPAGPIFKNAEPDERLDRTDADFVDIIHTNTLLYGINRTIGHVDFWVGGKGSWGAKQPGCKDGMYRWAKGKIIRLTDSRRKRSSSEGKTPKKKDRSCSHNRAKRYFEQSIDGTCKYEIPGTRGLRMGFFANKTKIPESGRDIFVTIKERRPFCSER